MPGLTPRRVNSVRTVVVWCLRGAAVVLLAMGSYLFLKKLFFAIGMTSSHNPTFGFFHMFRIMEGIGESQSTYRGLAMLVVGGALALGAKRIARWVITMPATGCPRCGYDGAVNDTCPECGLSGLETEGARDGSGVIGDE